MFCPYCGVKQDAGATQCTVCKKIIPSADAPRATPSATPQRPSRPTVSRSTDRFGSVGDRMLALVFDRALIGAFALVAAAAAADQAEELGIPAFLRTGTGAVILLAVAIFLYHFVFEAGFGTTLGKAVMGLQVRNESDRNRIVAVAVRNAMRIVDAVGLYLVGFLFATFRPRRQRLGDSIAGTVVLDMPMSKGARASMLVLLVIAIGVGLGVAWAICPNCLK